MQVQWPDLIFPDFSKITPSECGGWLTFSEGLHLPFIIQKAVPDKPPVRKVDIRFTFLVV